VVRRDFIHELVHLFEGEAFRLGHEYVCEGDATGTGRTPDEEDFDTEVAFVAVDYEGCDDSDDEVPEPVAGSAESNPF
jgi:hypothetical protein